MAKETRSNIWKYFSYSKEKTSRCLVQKGQKQCGKILKEKFATNKICTRKILKHVAQKRNAGELTVPEQEETARHLHHNYKKQ